MSISKFADVPINNRRSEGETMVRDDKTCNIKKSNKSNNHSNSFYFNFNNISFKTCIKLIYINLIQLKGNKVYNFSLFLVIFLFYLLLSTFYFI